MNQNAQIFLELHDNSMTRKVLTKRDLQKKEYGGKRFGSAVVFLKGAADSGGRRHRITRDTGRRGDMYHIPIESIIVRAAVVLWTVDCGV